MNVDAAAQVLRPGDRLLLVLPESTPPEVVTDFRLAVLERWPDLDVMLVVGAKAVVLTDEAAP